jgi:hypothetical protein
MYMLLTIYLAVFFRFIAIGTLLFRYQTNLNGTQNVTA